MTANVTMVVFVKNGYQHLCGYHFCLVTMITTVTNVTSDFLVTVVTFVTKVTNGLMVITATVVTMLPVCIGYVCANAPEVSHSGEISVLFGSKTNVCEICYKYYSIKRYSQDISNIV